MPHPNADETATVPVAKWLDQYAFEVGLAALHFVTPANWIDRWIEMIPGAGVEYYFYCPSDSGARAIVTGKLSGVAGAGTEVDPVVLTQDDETGGKLIANQPNHVFVSSGYTRFVMIADADNTLVCVRPAGE